MSAELHRVVGASFIGSSHQAAGVECQDAHAWLVHGGATVLAIADGAGSRPRSAEGSRCVVNAVTEFLEAGQGSIGDDWILEVFEGAIDALKRLSGDWPSWPSGRLDDFGTTLAVVLITEASVHIGQVGDSTVVLELTDGSLKTVSPEEKSEYANETVFLTSKTAIESLRQDKLSRDDIKGIALSTDGLRYKILDLASQQPHEPFYSDVFAYARSSGASSEAVVRFLEQLEEDQTGDDLTLLVCVEGAADERRGIGPSLPLGRTFTEPEDPFETPQDSDGEEALSEEDVADQEAG